MALPFYNWSLTAADNATADATVDWAEGMAPSDVNNSARAMMASTAAYREDTSGALTTAGTSTAYTLTTNQVFSSLSVLDGNELAFTMHTTSGATPTLAVDGLTAKVIRNATGVALPTGALLSGSVYRVKYDNSAGEFLINNQPGVLPSSSVGTATISDAAVTLAKLANLAANTFIGRYTASTGVPQALTLSTGLAVNTSTGAVTTTTSPALLPGFLTGLELSTAGSSATFGIAAGGANDTTNATLMALTSAYTKTTSAWAVGTGNGALDTGTIATSTWYHVYLIARSDTGVVDVLVSTSASSPTMPTNYDRKRRIGSMKTDGASQWTAFTQVHDEFIWSSSVQDLNNGAQATSQTLQTLTVPTGVYVKANFRAILGATTNTVRFQSPLETDVAASSTNCSLIVASPASAATDLSIMTNTSAQIAHRATGAAVAGLSINTYGWTDFRGK